MHISRATCEVMNTWYGCLHFLVLFQNLTGAIFSVVGEAHQQLDVCGNFVNLKICQLNTSEVLIGVGYSCVHVCS
jgi:hypothetical protein